MGVPAFFRWLSRKYPSIIVNCVEERPKECNGVKIPVDTSKPNPNEVEFDNLYLDMNGIIHPCTHPEDKPAPKNEDEMMVAIFEYIDRLFNIIRPRRLLYMAIDGVAPRAKMNQQRSRRFRASKEGMEATEEKQRVRQEILAKGGILPAEEVKERFDSNCITPGTEFMDNLAKCLRYYVADRLNNDPGWKNLTVILSDASAPGEGEHKIMDYIRRQRAQPNHDPNTHHCLCGADADLIMLGLATHEPNFTIIREEFKPNKPRPCALCNQLGHEVKDCQGLPREKQGEGYLTESGFVNLQRVQMIMLAVGEVEDNIFKKRKDDEENFKRRQKEKRKRMKRDQPSFIPGGQFSPQALGSGNRSSPQTISNPRQAAFEMRMQNSTPSASPNTSFTSDGTPSPAGGIKRKAEDSDSEPEPEDNIRLWEAGWKQRYYKNKFDVDASDEKFRRKVVRSYVEGLCWVLRYYYQGCASWKWFYPFHYAPFASDFDGIADLPSDFEKGTKPFRPLEQLMGVFPAASGNFLPPTWRKLMTDPESSIIDFYPEDFAIDLNGKKFAWQGVALLPFVDERRLRAALEEVYPDLTSEENRRNSLGGDVLFVGKNHSLCDFIAELYKSSTTEPVDMPPELCHGIQGKLSLNENAVLPDQAVQSPVPTLCDLTQNSAISINFKDPQFNEDFVFKAVVLPGAKKPPAVLKPGDWEKTNNNGRPWRPQLGFNRDRQPVHLDQSAFRTLGHAMSRERGQPGSGMYSNAAPLGAYQGNPYRPLFSGQPQIPKLLSNLRPQDSWRGPTPLFQQPPQRYDRSSGAAPLLAWNRMVQSQNAAFQQNQYQGVGGPMNYPQRPEDRLDRGRQGYGPGRPYPLPPPAGRYNWN
ncbi:PREDICTED: 5'-3' exoribonuclease 2 [Crocodylus porosus]|uniref:5'-3' exoribonuclease 2 n=1 Tax=Crocodylus porosus TaxID=8502 RepID=UPI00093DBC99|nr:PREDICTED: 5'-3' exoribonuclease 2 [Crocodylus porosus]